MKHIKLLIALIFFAAIGQAQTTTKPTGAVSIGVNYFRVPATDSVYLFIPGVNKYYTVGIYGQLKSYIDGKIAAIPHISASNGLTNSSGDIELGGLLSSAVTTVGSKTINQPWLEFNRSINPSVSLGVLGIGGTLRAEFYASQTSIPKSTMSVTGSTGDITNFSIESGRSYFSDNINQKGVVYLGDYDTKGILDDNWIPSYRAVKALSSALQTDVNSRIPLSQKAAANGVATLGSDGKIPNGQLPAIALTETFPVNSQAAMLALDAEMGDVAVRGDVHRSFILQQAPASTLANWIELQSPSVANTDQVPEGTTNLYFTQGRARTSVSAGTGISYNSTNGVITNSLPMLALDKTKLDGITGTNTGDQLIYLKFTSGTEAGIGLQNASGIQGGTATIPQANNANAGVMSSADKNKLDAITGKGESNLSIPSTSDGVIQVANSNGTGFSLNAATHAVAGILTAPDKRKLDSLSTSATNYTDADARAAISGSTGISYNSTTGVITNSLPMLAADKTKLDAITGTNTGNQTLGLGGTAGNIGISDGNAVSLSSLSVGGINRVIDADLTFASAGLWVNVHTTGSSNYPTPAGGGLIWQRGANSAVGAFQIDKTNIAEDELWFRNGIGTSTWGNWQRIASKEWSNINNIGRSVSTGSKLISNTVNIDTISTANISYLSSSSTHMPINGGGIVGTFLLTGAAENGTQSYTAVTSEDQSFYRRKQNGAWGSWFQTASRAWSTGQFAPITGSTAYYPKSGGALTGPLLASSNSTQTAPDISFNGDDNTGLWHGSPDNIGFTTGGVNRLTISPTGITSTLPVILPSGSVAAPALAFSSSANTGVWLNGTTFNIAIGGANKVAISPTNVSIASGISGSTASFSGAVASSVSPTMDNHLTRKDYVDNLVATKATDANVVHKTGDETITGIKSFTHVETDTLKFSSTKPLYFGSLRGGSGPGTEYRWINSAIGPGVLDLQVHALAGDWKSALSFGIDGNANFSGGLLSLNNLPLTTKKYVDSLVQAKVDSLGLIIQQSKDLTINFGLDFPSTAAGSTSTLTADMGTTLAVPGYPVHIGYTLAEIVTADNIYTGYVSSLGIVTVVFHNNSSVSVDPPSGNFQVRLARN